MGVSRECIYPGEAVELFWLKSGQLRLGADRFELKSTPKLTGMPLPVRVEELIEAMRWVAGFRLSLDEDGRILLEKPGHRTFEFERYRHWARLTMQAFCLGVDNASDLMRPEVDMGIVKRYALEGSLVTLRFLRRGVSMMIDRRLQELLIQVPGVKACKSQADTGTYILQVVENRRILTAPSHYLNVVCIAYATGVAGRVVKPGLA